MKSVRAAVFRAPQLPLAFECLPVPELAEGELMVRILATTICASDLHTYFGRRPAPAPSILGHEIVGEVIASRRQDFGPGQRITWSMVWSCGACTACSRGLRPKCEKLFKFGHAAFDAAPLSGGLAEMCVLPVGTHVFPVPAAIPDTLAATANCAIATVMAAIRRAPQIEGRRVFVQGLGMLGLTACAAASVSGAAQVYAFDLNPRRLGLAADFGATPVQGPVAADLAFDFTGHPAAIESAVSVAAPGCHFLLIGSVFPQRPLALDAQHLVKQLLTVSGVHNYNPEDLESALHFLQAQQGRYPFAALVERTFPLSKATAAFELAEHERPVRVAILPL